MFLFGLKLKRILRNIQLLFLGKDRFLKNILKNDNGLSDFDISKLGKKLLKYQKKHTRIQEEILYYGLLLEYDKMKKSGIQSAQLLKFLSEDADIYANAQQTIDENFDLHEHMFGYPVNLKDDTALVRYLRNRENELYLMNNCGDPYECGNYRMDAKSYEKDILNIFYERFGINPEKGWGYITAGTSEGNKWGIYNGLKKYHNGRLYFSEATHYSVEKTVKNGEKELYPYSIIKQTSNISEKIDKEALFKEVLKNWEEKQEPVILVLTWGTTKAGAIDDVKEISTWFKENKIPHYIHLDAALFGGISKQQLHAPVVPNLDTLGVDSVSVSFHKYIGSPQVNSVVIAREKGDGTFINYIGQNDTTTAGSRAFPPFSTLQRIKETLDRPALDDYNKNIDIFEKMLNSKNIKYIKENLSNIFVIQKPSDEICKQYQLATFTDKSGNDMAHIIIFPFHKITIMQQLADDLEKDLK